MRKARRSAERLSYWPEVGSRALTRREQGMPRSSAVNSKCLPTAAKALIFLELVLLVALTSTKLQAQGPALTTISDTVYRADGTGASGTALISWPSFQTAGGDAVAAGNLSVTIGPLGAFTVQLVPNVGASPAGTYYVVVFQLDDGTVRTEYWAVPATSPTTIAAVLTTPGTGLGNLAATEQYVNAAVAPLAVDATVVHLAGTETITGTKQFTVPPSLPVPVGASDAANKGYVDTAVENVGSGAYVPIAGGTMTGPLTLAADPTAPNQAADQHYVVSGLAAKADLVAGTVPTGELGAGVASSATCLNGNSTWGSCGGGAPAGVTYATTALNWTQTISSSLTSGSQATVTLTPCPVGIDTTSGAGYQVLLSGGGNSEAVSVVTAAGGCTSGAASGTIIFTPFYSYAAGYTIGSASSGIQETLNAACGVTALPAWGNNGGCNVTIPGVGPGHTLNTYNVYGTVVVHMNQSMIEGYGASLNCLGRGPCLRVGDLASSNDTPENTIKGLSFRAPLGPSTSSSYAGVNVTATQRTGGYVTITTSAAHNFRPGDLVTVLFTDNPTYWGDATVYDCGSGTSSGSCTSSSTTFRYSDSGGTVASQSTPGVVALEYCAVVDNAMATHFIDIFYDNFNAVGKFNNFFDMWDDEEAVIDHFSNSTTGGLNGSATWAGSYVFSGAGHSGSLYPNATMAPVITLKNSNIQGSIGVTDYNSNGLYIYDSVIQGTVLWQVYSSNTKGNYAGVTLKNIYSENNLGQNPISPAKTPFPGTGLAGLIVGRESSSAINLLDGTPTYGTVQTGGAGSTVLAYFIVAHDGSSQTSPMEVLQWSSTGSDNPVVYWPRVANVTDTITYDIVRMGVPGANSPLPSYGNCPGGSLTACGSVATGIAQCSGLVCSYTDTGVPNTSAYTVNPGSYTGALSFWPGSIVTVTNPVQTSTDSGAVVGVGLGQNFYNNPAVVARLCANGGQASAGNFVVCQSSIGTNANQTAMLMPDGQAGQPYSLSKGRLNFAPAPSSTLQAHHIITLIDSNPGQTQATPGFRPAASANDTWIGTDVPNNSGLSSGQLAFGAPVSITNYIAQTGDGVHANWLERLSASLKEFNVPVKFDQSVTLAGLSNGCLNITSGVIASTGSSCGSGSGGNVSSVFGRSGAVVAATGDYSVSQVTGAAADAAVVHLANTETVTGAKTFTSNVTMSGNLLLPQGSGFVPAVGGIGLDTGAGLPVVNIGGTTQQIALTSSNISGQAGTALALAATPTQCSGSFATGIAANGNANCTTPDVIQLAETTPPAGIANWGVFWFDSATHTPRVIDNNGQVMQLGLTNLFNSDPGGDPADNLEERNGSNVESFRVYSNFVNNTTWQRTSLGFDTADGYAVIRSENATSGSAPGLGLWIGSGLKWVVDAAGNFKAWADNAFNVGSDTGQAAKSIFAKTSFNSVLYGRNDFEIPNDGSTGTVLNQLAVFNTNSPSQAVLASTSSSNGVIGVVQGGAGKSGSAVITWHGYAYCIFDNATTAGDAVIASTSTAGDCHDTGSGAQPSAQLIGYVDLTNATAGQAYGIRVSLQPAQVGGGGNVASVFGRTGAVTAQTGDYTVSQVTGAAVDSAVVHLAGAETIAGAKTFSSTVTLSGNLNVAGNINQMGTGPTQWSGQEWTGTTVTVPSGMAFSLGVGSDNTFRCQLTSGASCMPSSGGGMVYPGAGVPNSTGSAWGTSYGTSGSGTTLALTASPVFTGAPIVPGYVANTTTVNGHALSSNVTVSASDLTTGTLPHAQLPALVSGDIPNNAANTSGTAANLSGTPSLPNGITATTQTAGDNSAKIATDALVFSLGCSNWMTRENGSGTYSFTTTSNKASIQGVILNCPLTTTQVTYDVLTADNTANTYDIGLYNTSGALLAHIGTTAGTTFAPSTGFKTISWTGGSVYLVPGKYYLATTTSCTATCAAIASGNSASGFTFYNNVSVSVSAGGTLSAISAPSDTPSVSATIPAWWIH
jgi:hypothetical protein